MEVVYDTDSYSKVSCRKADERKLWNTNKNKEPRCFLRFCDGIEAQTLALRLAGNEDPQEHFGELFGRAAIHALLKGGE